MQRRKGTTAPDPMGKSLLKDIKERYSIRVLRRFFWHYFLFVLQGSRAEFILPEGHEQRARERELRPAKSFAKVSRNILFK